MDMWTYGHLDIWIHGHVAVMQDMTIYITVYWRYDLYIHNSVLKTLTENVQNINNMGNLPVFLNVYSLKTFCHIRRFVLISFVSVDVLSHYTFCCYTFCPLDVLSLYALSLNHRITFKHCIILMKLYLVNNIVLVRPASISERPKLSPSWAQDFVWHLFTAVSGY